MTCLVVIPARWGSSRLPGKPLAMIAGRPLLSRVIALARRATRGMAGVELVVATDDDRVATLAAASSCAVAMTDADLSSGSARALAAALARSPAPAHVVNLQGDAPFLPPGAIRAVIDALTAGAAVATPVVRLGWAELDALRKQKERAPFSGTTCAIGPDGHALWFSKAVIPAMRDETALRAQAPLSPVYRHLGLYGYSLEALQRFDRMPPGRYEQLEGLEQLRLLENGIPLRVVEIAAPLIPISGIDTNHDIALAERLIAALGDPADAA